MYPFGPYQQPPAQKPPFLQQVLNYLPNNAQNTPPAMPPFSQVPYQQTGGLVNSITKVHKGLQVVQQVLPIWKQYAPLIKNAPMLIDMAKIMLSEELSDDEDESPSKSGEEEGSIEEYSFDVQSKQEMTEPIEEKNEIDGIPGPKLYI